MRRITFEDLCINLSILFYIIVCCIRMYIDNLILSNLTTVLLLFANLLLLLNMIRIKKIKIVSKKYFIVAMFLLLPSLYKNAYFIDHLYTYFFYYLLTISYSILFCFSNIKKGNIEFALKLIIIFAFATGIVTWISLFSPSFYIEKIIPLMPKNNQSELIINFVHLNARMGLTSHYSRNAFYLMIGILCSIYFLFEHKKIKWKLSVFFLVMTMLIIGKRGHFLFLIIALLMAYFILFKVSLKTVIKLLTGLILASIVLFVAIKIQPEINKTFERFFTNEGDDISSGRFGMYQEIWEMYKANGYIGIGWNGYASKTNYTHPGVHNDYIQLICETGIIGFIMVIGANMYILKHSINYMNNKQNSISFIILVYNIFFLLYSLTGLPHYDVETYMFYFFMNCCLFNIDSSGIEFNRLLKFTKKKERMSYV